jgi:hypothetical protein
MDQLRGWFSEYDTDLDNVRRFWQGEGRVTVSLYPAAQAYRQSFDDATILAQATRFLEAQAHLPGTNLPSFFPDWGTISTARYWGGEPRFDSTGGNIFIDPVAQTLDEALALIPLAVDAPATDGARALRLWRDLSGQLGTHDLWLRSPDMQGTLNTAGLVMHQEELWMAMYSEPAKVHAFLEQVCDLLIRYAHYLRQETAGLICGNIWPYTFFPAEFGISLTEDMMPLMSAKLYKAFGIPYLRALGEALGGLHIHCCGDWGRHAANLKAAGLPIRAVEFHYPFTTIEELAPLAGDTVFIPYIMLERQNRFVSQLDYYRYLLAETPQHYRYWFALGDDGPEARAFAAKMEGREVMRDT